jgi:hypothetical protein
VAAAAVLFDYAKLCPMRDTIAMEEASKESEIKL